MINMNRSVIIAFRSLAIVLLHAFVASLLAAVNPVSLSVNLVVTNADQGPYGQWYASVIDGSPIILAAASTGTGLLAASAAPADENDYVYIEAKITPSWIPVSNLRWTAPSNVEIVSANKRKLSRRQYTAMINVKAEVNYNENKAEDNENVAVVDIVGSTVVAPVVSVKDGEAAPDRTDFCCVLKGKDDGIVEVTLQPNVDPAVLPAGFITWQGGKVGANQKQRKFARTDPIKTSMVATLKAAAPRNYTIISYAIWCDIGSFSPSGETGRSHFEDNNNSLRAYVNGTGFRDVAGVYRNLCEIQFTVVPIDFVNDGKAKLYDKSRIVFDVRRDRQSIGFSQHSPGDQWIPEGPPGTQLDWVSDDSDNTEEDNNPFDSDKGNIYGTDAPSAQAYEYKVITKSNFREWVWCSFDQTNPPNNVLFTSALAENLASGSFDWHSAISIIRENWGPTSPWLASTEYVKGDRVTDDGFVFECIEAGKTGTIRPTENGSENGNLDGTVRWKYLGAKEERNNEYENEIKLGFLSWGKTPLPVPN